MSPGKGKEGEGKRKGKGVRTLFFSSKHKTMSPDPFLSLVVVPGVIIGVVVMIFGAAVGPQAEKTKKISIPGPETDDNTLSLDQLQRKYGYSIGTKRHNELHGYGQ